MSGYVTIPSDRMRTGDYDADDDTFVDVAEGLRETGGPTTLTAGVVADGQVVTRSGTTYAGVARAGVDTDATTHAGATNNPHATDIDNLGAGTLAELNSAVSDATLDDSGDARPPSAHTHGNADLTGVPGPGIDTDASAHASLVIGTAHSGTLAQLNAGLSDTNLTPYSHDVDLSGTYDWSANGDGSQDTTSGLYAYEAAGGDLAAATLEVGTNVITWSVAGTTDPADREVFLVARLDGLSLADLYLAQSICVTISLNVTSMGSISGDNMSVYIANEDVANTAADESIRAILKYDGANRTVNVQRVSNNNLTSGATSNVAQWNAASTRITMRASIGLLAADHFDASGNNQVTPATVAENNWHGRSGGANAPYIVISMRGKGDGATPGTSAGTISAINVRIS